MVQWHSDADKTMDKIALALSRIEILLGDRACTSEARRTIEKLKGHLGTAKSFIQNQVGGHDHVGETVDDRWMTMALKLTDVIVELVPKYTSYYDAAGPPQREEGQGLCAIPEWMWITEVESCFKRLVELREQSVPEVPVFQLVIAPAIEPQWWSSCLLLIRKGWSALVVVTEKTGNLVGKRIPDYMACQVEKLSVVLKGVPGAMAGQVQQGLAPLWSNPREVAIHVGTLLLWRIPEMMAGFVIGVGRLMSVRSPSPADSMIIDLVNFLTNDYLTDQLSEVLPRKVLSIVGPAGTGKAALAYRLLKETESNFNCFAYVKLDKWEDKATVLANILRQIDKHSQSVGNQDEGVLREKIHKFLIDKRYLIVITDVRGTDDDWKSIKRALPDNNQCSRVIINTSRNDVAENNCKGRFDLIYRLPAIDADKNMSIQGQDLDQKLREGLFVDWSSNLRTCLQYLIPDGARQFERDSTARKWVACGFVTRIQDARDCFDELINRNVIQPVEEGYSFEEEPTYRVHTTVLRILREGNSSQGSEFATGHFYVQQSSPGQTMMDEAITNLNQVRSITISGSVKGVILQLRQAANLLVLDLEACTDIDEEQLGYICQMGQLRYLSLKKTLVDKFPADVRNLKQLETLDLRETPFRKLPKELSELKLAYLLFCPGVTIDEAIPFLSSVKVLGAVNSTEYRRDVFTHSTELHELQVVYQQQDGKSNNDPTFCSHEAPILPGLEKLKVAGRLVSIPGWIKQGKLDSVASLDIRVVSLKDGDLDALGRMNSLKSLVLALVGIPRKQILVTASTGFDKLEVLALDCRAPWLGFEEGAMPALKRLHLKLYACLRGEKILSGTTHLANLNEVTLQCSEIYLGSTCLKEATTAVVEEARVRTKPIAVYISGVGRRIPRIEVPEDTRKLRRFWLARKLKQLFFHYVYSLLVDKLAHRYAFPALAAAYGCASAFPGQLHDLWHDRYMLDLIFRSAIILLLYFLVPVLGSHLLSLLDRVVLDPVRRFPTWLSNWFLSWLPDWSRIWLTNWFLKWLADRPLGETIVAFLLFSFLFSFIIPMRYGRERFQGALMLLSFGTIIIAIIYTYGEF